jgi:hypothetical protein
MSLYDRLKSDNARILGGDDMQDVTLHNTSGTLLAGKARVTSVGMDVNSQGQMFATKKHSIGFHISDYVSIISSNETFSGWRATFLNSQNETVSGYFENPLVDKTLDYVVATLKEKKVIS